MVSESSSTNKIADGKYECRYVSELTFVPPAAADFGLQETCNKVNFEKSFHDFVHLYTCLTLFWTAGFPAGVGPPGQGRLSYE